MFSKEVKTTSKCSLCGSVDTSKVLKATSFNIWKCNICLIAFTDPSPIIPDYTKMDFHAGEDLQNAEKQKNISDLPTDWQMLINKQINLILKSIKKEDTILEIGCGEGILLEELQKLGYQNIKGFEPSKTAAVRASRKGLSIENSYFDVDSVKDTYDLVMMSHVLEHVEDPIVLLKDIRTILKPGGFIMLTQTNFKGLMPYLKKEAWYAWVPDQHFWHFTPDGLDKIFTEIGFKTKKVKYCTLVHPQDVFYKLARFFTPLQDQFIVLAQNKNH